MQIFIIFNAVIYLFLGIWCALQPHKTAASVGLGLLGAQGIAEYVAVYGGLEFSIGIMCTALFFNPELYRTGIAALCILYGCLALFRIYSTIRFGSDLSNGWYFFALELSFFLISLYLLVKRPN